MKRCTNICFSRRQGLCTLNDHGRITIYSYAIKCRQANETPEFLLISNYADSFYSVFGFHSLEELMRYLQTQLIEKCRFESPVIEICNDVALCVLAHSFFKHNRCRFGERAKYYIDLVCMNNKSIV